MTVEGIYKIGGVVGSGIAYGCSASGTVTSLLTDNNAFVTDINENVKIRNAQIPPGSVLTWSGRYPAYYLADEKLSCAYYDYAGGVAGTGTAVSCRSSVTVKAENLQAVGGVVGGGKGPQLRLYRRERNGRPQRRRRRRDGRSVKLLRKGHRPRYLRQVQLI